MKVPSPTQGNTRPSARGMAYLQAATPDFSGLVQGLSSFGASIEARNKAEAAEKDQLTKFKTMVDYNAFETSVNDQHLALKQQAKPDQANFREVADTEYTNLSNKFLETIDPSLQDEYKVKIADLGGKISADARSFQLTQQNAYYKQGVDQAADTAKQAVENKPDDMEVWQKKVEDQIDASGLSEIEKAEMKRLNAESIQGIGYRKAYEQHKLQTQGVKNELTDALRRGAAELGIDPVDLATVISYETRGKFSTSIRGGKDNKYIGLIQFGPAEQLKYGARQGQSYAEQMGAVVAYLKDRGFKPGMSILDLYSTINAGSPGRYSASDANNGGAPGTVADKVRDQMGGHQKNAIALFGGQYEVPDDIDENPRYQAVTYEDRVALRKQGDQNASEILTARSNMQKAASEAFKNQLMLGILDGKMGQKELDESRQYGMLTDYGDIKAAQDLIDKKSAEGSDLRAAQDKLDSNGLWDFTNSDDKKLANTWFGASGQGALANGDAKYFDGVLKPFVQKSHMIPPNAIGMLDAMSRTTNPKQSLFALNALASLHDAEPDAYERQVPGEVQDNVEFWQARRNLFDEKETLDIIGGRMTSEQRAARTVLGKEADDFLNNPKNESYTTFDTVLQAITPDTWMPFESTAQAPVWASAKLSMQNEWQTLVKENYIKSGDWTIAQQLAIKQLSRTWGETDFGGRKTLMKWPPNKVGYKPVAGSMKWIEDQTRTDLRLMPDVPIQLISDDTTQGQFFATQKWESQGYGTNIVSGTVHAMSRPTPPSYLVAVQGPDGWKLATNADGQIVRQHFEMTPALKAEEQASFEIKMMEDELKQDFLRLTEAGNMAQVTGQPVPQELYDTYNAKRVVVDKAKEDMTRRVQGPPSTPQGNVRPEGPLALNLLGDRPKPKVVVPGVDVKTLEGYPPPALGMLSAGNVAIEWTNKDAYLLDMPEDGGIVLIPKVDSMGKPLTFREAQHLYETSANHMGIFADKNSAEDYLKKLRGK